MPAIMSSASVSMRFKTVTESSFRVQEVFDLQSKTCPMVAPHTRCLRSCSRFAKLLIKLRGPREQKNRSLTCCYGSVPAISTLSTLPLLHIVPHPRPPSTTSHPSLSSPPPVSPPSALDPHLLP